MDREELHLRWQTEAAKAHKPIGRYLNELWEVGVSQALYSQWGNFYGNLKKFPGALFDPEGYVIFKTSGEYNACKQLLRGKQLNVPGTIGSIDGYVRKV